MPDPTPADRQAAPDDDLLPDVEIEGSLFFPEPPVTQTFYGYTAERLAELLEQARAEGREEQRNRDCVLLCPHCAAGSPAEPGERGGARWEHPNAEVWMSPCLAGRLRDG